MKYLVKIVDTETEETVAEKWFDEFAAARMFVDGFNLGCSYSSNDELYYARCEIR